MFASKSLGNNVVRRITLLLLFLGLIGAIVPLTCQRGRASSRTLGNNSESMSQHIISKQTVKTKERAHSAFARLPISFEANTGQADPKVKFLFHGPRFGLFLTTEEAVLSLCKSTATKSHSLQNEEAANAAANGQQSNQTSVVRMTLIGANRSPRMTGLDALSGKSNYFLGNDPNKWRTNLTNYAKVEYSNVYRAIDLIYYGNQQQLEYDFVVRPGANPNDIRLSFKGVEKAEIDTRGDLVLHTPNGDIRHRKPIIYQEMNGARQEINGIYVIKGKNRIGFKVSGYDAARTLVIDPSIVYSTYLGGSGTDSAKGVAVYTDSATNTTYAYVVGNTDSTDFPINNVVQPPGGAAFVAKFNLASSGNDSLVFASYVGNGSVGNAIAVDSGGNSYITGNASSTLPVVNAFQSVNHGNDAFVTELSADGSSLIYSSYLGGAGEDRGHGIAVDSAGNTYVTGLTLSVDFPLANPYQATCGNHGNVFVTKIAPPSSTSPASLAYSTYLGGSGVPNVFASDIGWSIAVSSNGNIYVGGRAFSPDFPIKNAFESVHGGGFLAVLDPSVSGSQSLKYSTLIAADRRDGNGVTGVAVDSAGNAYVTGITGPPDFVTTQGAFKRTPTRSNSTSAFVTKIDPSQSGAASLVYSTYVGSASSSLAIAVDSGGNAYITGNTYDPGFPVLNSTQLLTGGVLQSINGGANWKGMSHGLTNPYVTALAIDTSTVPRSLYAGTVANNRGDVENGDFAGGIFKSTDGGNNWTAINAGLTDTDIVGLAISPTNSSTIYATTYSGVFKSSDGGSNWTALNTGLADSSSDLGVIHNNLLFDKTTTPATLYVWTKSGLYKMTDGATSWTAVAGFQVYDVAIDPKSIPSTIYAASSFGLQKSQDQGGTWINVSTNLPISFIAVDTSTNPSTLFGFDPSISLGEAGSPPLLKSGDGGTTWQLMFYPFFQVAPRVGFLAVDPAAAAPTLYLGTGNGLFKSTDGGNNWTHLLGDEGIASLALDPTSATATTPSTIYAGGDQWFGLDIFVTELNSSGSGLVFSTLIGGSGREQANGIATDQSGNVYVVGFTESQDFPTVNAYQPSDPGGYLSDSLSHDVTAFLTKLGSAALPLSSTNSVTTQVATQTGTLDLTLPNITGSTTSTAPTLTVNQLDSATTANLTLSNNLGAYEIKTTATYDTSSYSTDPTKGIKLTFSVLTVNDPAVFNNLVITHGEDANGDGIIQPGEMVPYNGLVNSNKVTDHDYATRTVWIYVPSLSPFVIVKGAADQFNDLIRAVKGFNLKAGIENSLDAKLQNALKAYQAALAKDRATACNQMASFINEVQAQTGKALTQTQANQLIASANQIKVVLGCR